MEQDAERVVMRQSSSIQERSVHKERCRHPSALQDGSDHVIHLAEAVVEGQMKTRTPQGPIAVESLDDLGQRDRLKMTPKELDISSELSDRSKPIEGG